MTNMQKNDFGIFADIRNTTRVDSRDLARAYGRSHKDILRRVDAMRRRGFSADFCRENFLPMESSTMRGASESFYGIARDGFLALVKDFLLTADASTTKAYVERFDRMDAWIAGKLSAQREFPHLTRQIYMMNEDARPFEYSNEADMLNRIVLGVSAAQYRTMHHLPKNADIRAKLTEHENAMLNMLQTFDIGLLVGVPSYTERRQQLTRIYHEWTRMLAVKAACSKNDRLENTNKGDEHEN